jgi:hypothetical protein
VYDYDSASGHVVWCRKVKGAIAGTNGANGANGAKALNGNANDEDGHDGHDRHDGHDGNDGNSVTSSNAGSVYKPIQTSRTNQSNATHQTNDTIHRDIIPNVPVHDRNATATNATTTNATSTVNANGNEVNGNEVNDDYDEFGYVAHTNDNGANIIGNDDISDDKWISPNKLAAATVTATATTSATATATTSATTTATTPINETQRRNRGYDYYDNVHSIKLDSNNTPVVDYADTNVNTVNNVNNANNAGNNTPSNYRIKSDEYNPTPLSNTRYNTSMNTPNTNDKNDTNYNHSNHDNHNNHDMISREEVNSIVLEALEIHTTDIMSSINSMHVDMLRNFQELCDDFRDKEIKCDEKVRRAEEEVRRVMEENRVLRGLSQNK